MTVLKRGRFVRYTWTASLGLVRCRGTLPAMIPRKRQNIGGWQVATSHHCVLAVPYRVLNPSCCGKQMSQAVTATSCLPPLFEPA
ncbi:hypothetical protein K466DRAFT_587521 [Polyporus arcularius HHB13444]|uniref:Uncharacterized protein n=1 Tax=Polyporus arcularius HHB13444 TaxID=1314778 RepID=A0A5C3PAY0_9APHY|nr:hypothetical protein K466DRAFT_587521 [Polyporus arcularius HHB13444]